MAGKPSPSLTVGAAAKPTADTPAADDHAWQDEQTRQALAEADAGDFASAEEVMSVVRKFVPDA